MSERHKKVIRELYGAWNLGDPAAVFRRLDPNFELHDAPEFPQARIYVGTRAAWEYFRLFWDHFRVEIQELRQCNDKVVALLHERPRPSGESLGQDFGFAHVWTLQNDRALRCRIYFDRRAALRSVGIRD